MRVKLFGSFGSLLGWLFAALAAACSGTGQSAAGAEDMPGPLVELRVRFPPQKTEYYVGELLEPGGLVVEGRYANSGVREIPNDQLVFLGFDSSVPVEQQAVTVSFHGLTTQFAVSINPAENLNGMEVRPE